MMWIDDRPSIPCGLCGTPTPMTGTKRCDRCWELESRIYSDPALAQKILDDMKQQGQATPPSTPVDVKTLSEFMAEQEALHPGFHDKVQAAADELRAEVVRPKREDECLTLDHWRMRAYALEENWSRCSRACAVEQTKREQAEAHAKQLAEALREATAMLLSDYPETAKRLRTVLRDQEEDREQ